MQANRFVYPFMMTTALALAAPSLAQNASGSKSEQNTQQRNRDSSDRNASQQMPVSVIVTSAEELVGRDVVGIAGKPTGEIEHLMIDVQTGAVTHVLVGGGNGFDIGDGFVPVPWRAVHFAQGDGPVHLWVDADALRLAPRYQEEQIDDLTQPVAVTYITNYYAPIIEKEKQSHGAEHQTSHSGPNQQSGRSQQNASSQGSSNRRDEAASGGRRGQQASNQHAGSGDQGRSGQEQAGPSVPHLLVARDYTTIIAPPAFVQGSEIRGMVVRDRDGVERGEIDQIMIDVDRGQVAYVLLESGGFLGLGGEWLPVPMAALRWTPADNAGFILQASAAQLKEVPRLAKEDLPARVSGAQLKQLYDQYGVKPYWEESEQTASTDKKG